MKIHLNQLKIFNPKSLLIIGSVFACSFWFMDAAIDTFIFKQQTLYLESLLRPEPIELWTRLQAVLLIMSISIIAMFMLRRQHNITEQLQSYKTELEDTVFERTSDLRTKNAMLEQEIMERLKIEAELLHLATIDPLTSIPNRRKFNEVLDYELKRDARHHHDLSIILCDLDYFKNINDDYGHNIGDEVLKQFTRVISNSIRKADVFARWGGEEFVILLPETDIGTAIKLADKLRAVTEEHQYPSVKKITASFGVTRFTKGDNETKFINRADDALYKAKENGRNRVEAMPPAQFPLHLISDETEDPDTLSQQV